MLVIDPVHLAFNQSYTTYAYPVAAWVASCNQHLHVALDHHQECSLVVVLLHMVAFQVLWVSVYVVGMVFSLAVNLG